MKTSVNSLFLILISLILSAIVFTPLYAAGDCSSFVGQATFNEFFKDKTNQANDPDDFVEIKIIDLSIPFSTYSQWSIQLCENDGQGNNNDADGCSGSIVIADFGDTTIPWLVLKDGTIGDFFNFKSGFDAILLDSNDDVIDYLSVDGHTQQESPACPGASLPFDTDANAPGASDKFIFRSPDGTGDWEGATSAAQNPTENGTNNPTPTPDHFNINVGGGLANTCNPFSFSITAEDASNNPISDYTGTVLLTTSTTNGNFSTVLAVNNIIPNPDNDDNGSAGYSFDVLDGGSLTLALANEHAETLTISVTDLSIPLTSTSANITFSDNAFNILDNDLLVAGDNVPVAGRDHNYQIQMIRKDPLVGCGVATGYTGPKSLKMWRTKNVSDPSPNDPVLAGVSLPPAEPITDNGNITFIDGVANVIMQTVDIGKFNVELADSSNTFAAITIAGTSIEQTVRPFGIGIDFSSLRDVDFSDNGFIDDSTGTDLSFAQDISGSIFTQAGEDFSITVEGILWNAADDSNNDGVPDPSAYLGNNVTTPSFGLEGETVSLTATLVEPVGATPGALTVNGIAGGLFNNFTSGSQTAVMTYSNVGIITLNASLTDSDYFLSGVNVIGPAPNVGRFNPYQFAITAGTVISACNAVLPFTYSRQPFTTSITLQAESKNSVITDGYRAAYATLDVANELNIENGASNAAYDLASFTITESFSSGVIGRSQFDIDLTWDMALQAATVSQVNIIDTTDEVTLISASPFSPGSTEVRFGRLALDNVFGSELTTLTMPMYTEYYDGSNFVVNGDDGCTQVNDADLSVTSFLSGGSSSATVVSPTSVNGVLNIDLSPPGAGNTGDIVITLDLVALGFPWLQFDWDGDAAHDNDPTATATFGIFSGNDINIYKLQTYQ